MNEADYSSANILSRLFSSISVDKLKESSDVMTAWKQTLFSIKGPSVDAGKTVNYGSQLFDHSRIVDLKNETLIVETDHPGRIQMFQMYKRYILNGLKKAIPDIPVSNIVFKLQKVETLSSVLRMPTREELDRAADAANTAANAASSFSSDNSRRLGEDAEKKNSSEKTGAPLPPELQDMFASMKDALSH